MKKNNLLIVIKELKLDALTNPKVVEIKNMI